MFKVDLIEAIEKVKIAMISGSTFLQDSNNLIFKNDRIAAFGLDSAISIPFQFPFEASVPADEFLKYLKKVKGDEIDIEYKDGELTIVSGNGKSSAAFMTNDSVRNLPDLGIKDVQDWVSLPNNFCDALKLVHFSVSNDTSKGIYNCAFVDKTGIAGTDEFRLTHIAFNETYNGPTFFIPKKIAKHVSAMDWVKVGKAGGWVHLMTEEGVVASIRGLEGAFRQYEDKLKLTGTSVYLPTELQDALNRISELCEKDSFGFKKVFVTLFDGEASCKVDGQRKRGEEKVFLEYTGERVSFSANVDFLIDALKEGKDCIVGEKMIMISGDGFRHIVVLMKN